MADEVTDAVIEVLSGILPIDASIKGTDDLLDHGLTSFESVTLVVALEEQLGISFPDDSLFMENFRTIDKIVDLVRVTRAADGLPA